MIDRCPQTIHNWITRGDLECVVEPSGPRTSFEAYLRMTTRLQQERNGVYVSRIKSPAAMQREHRRAEKQLREAGVLR
ncbi:MAG TPA: hypothetical protein VKD72_33170 [Gemmataceae bacterium]|nr:hypothetical protein [Gemmataceae bacterium]